MDLFIQPRKQECVLRTWICSLQSVPLLEGTPAVLSRGRLGDENGYSCEWKTRSTPGLIKIGKIAICKCDNFMLYRRSWKIKWNTLYDLSSWISWKPQGVNTRRTWEGTSRQQCIARLAKMVGEIDGKCGETFICFISKWPQRSNGTTSNISFIRENTEEITQFVFGFSRGSKLLDVQKYTKVTRASCRQNSNSKKLRATKVGDIFTAVRNVINEEGESSSNHRYAVIVHALATQCMDSKLLVWNNTSQETARNFRRFLNPDENLNVIYNGNSLKFGEAGEDLEWNHSTSTLHRPEVNGIVERAVWRVKEGTSSLLLQSGLDEQQWSAESMQYSCYLRKMQDLLSNGCEEHSSGPITAFWTKSDYSKRSGETPSVWHESIPRLFHGLSLSAKGSWTGDLLGADIEELREQDASNVCSRKTSKTAERQSATFRVQYLVFFWPQLLHDFL